MRNATDPGGARTSEKQRRRLRRVAIVGVVALLGIVLPSLISPAGAASDPVQVNFDLRGCNNDGSPVISLPDGNGDFLCPDSEYDNGNLGKGWSELDLVPHRVIIVNNGSSQTYAFAVAGDYTHSAGDYPNRVGWDVVSPLVLNTAKSDATGCGAASNGPQTITPSGAGVGGADQTIYRIVTITQAADSTCVYDYYQRLALGAHNFSGASLQSNLWSQTLGSFGQERLSLPVNEIAPQELTKDMSAVQGSDHIWDITKGATPDHVDFPDTCLPGAPLDAQVSITVTWTKRAATPSGDINIVTHVYARNPATRTITVTASDDIQSGVTILEHVQGAPVNVPANTEMLVLTHQTTVPAGTTNLNDVARATYTDLVTGVPVPGTTTATAVGVVQQTGPELNQTATITDTETITGGLTYTVDSTSGASGTFAGSTWTSAPQTGSGSVTINKTVHASAGTSGSGTLSDHATVTGSDGFTASADASVSIDYDASVGIVVSKTQSLLFATDKTFHFTATKSGSSAPSGSVDVTIPAGSFGPATGTIAGLEPGTYTVHEDATAPYQSQDQSVTVTLPSCSETVTFENAAAPASAQVAKATEPGGATSWDFTLTGVKDGNPVMTPESVTVTANTGFLPFTTPLEVDGATYTITETGQTDWDLTAISGSIGGGSVATDTANLRCSTTLNLTASSGATFQCSFSNTQRGTIIVRKATDPAGSAGSFTFTGDAAGTISDGGMITVQHLTPGTYTSTEGNPAPAYDLVSITCDDGSSATASSGSLSTRTATFALDAGETVTCTFTNRARGTARVVKTVNGAAPSGAQAFTFQLRQGATPTETGTTLESGVANAANGGNISFTTTLTPGATYQLCEVTMPGWQTTLGTFVPDSFLPPDGQVLDPTVDNSIICANFTVAAGEVKVFTVDNTPPPGGRALTIGFWKNWASCSASGGRQKPVLDQVLATFPIAGGQTTHGVFIGSLYVDTCQEAVSLLNKSAINNGKKMASDPAYNLAAQLMATELNFQAGAGKCPAVVTAEAQAQALLAAAGFNGTGSYKSMSAANQTLANQLATTLDRYNNNLLC